MRPRALDARLLLEACDAAGYDAMAWEMSQQDCVCFMQDQCECVYTDECRCEGKDGLEPWMMSESECAAHGCEYEVLASRAKPF